MEKDATHPCSSYATCSCSYCDCQHTQLEFALHKLTNAHVKNIQKALFQRGFSSVCLVCNLALKDLKHMELHVQEKKHTEQMIILNDFLSPDKYTCRSCGIAFFNEVALEAHRLLGLHNMEASPPASPKLNELSKQLSGLCGTWLLTNGCNLCSVCNVTLDGIQETVMHCFTSAHITRLRASFCMVCKKDFMHAPDRESHLNSAKHLSTFRKCSYFLEEAEAQRSHRKGGYACMFCMIWCNSWFCLEIHMLEIHHSKVLAEYKRNNPIASRIVFVPGQGGTGATCSCNESVKNSWKVWREQALEEDIWCHRCGSIISGIDEANQHLADGCQMSTTTSHSENVSGPAQFPNTYECPICTMSFKSSFMLSAHTASLEHHKRPRVLSSSNIAYSCSNCGILVEKDKHGDDVSAHKDVTGSLVFVKENEAFVRCLKLPSSGFHAADDSESVGVARFLKGSHQSSSLATAKDDFIQGSLAHLHHTNGNGLFAKNDINEGHSKQNWVGRVEVPVHSPGKDLVGHKIRNKDNNLIVDESGMAGCFKNSCSMPANVLGEQIGNHGVGGDKNIECKKDNPHSNVSVSARVVNSCNSPHLLPHKPNKLEDSLLPQNEGYFIGQRPLDTSSILVKNAGVGGLGVPVIVAATVAPLEGLQESLKSVTAIVTETLLSTVSFLKRKSCGDMNEPVESTHLKRLYREGALEAALQQGLKSIKSDNGQLRLQQGAAEGMVRLSPTVKVKEEQEIKGEQDLRAVIAVAASAIPPDLPDFFRPSTDQNQTVVGKAQESSVAQIPDNACNQAQELAGIKDKGLDEVANQAVIEQSRTRKVVEESRAQVEQPFQCQPGFLSIRPGNCMQPPVLSGKDRTEGDGSLEASKTAVSLNVHSHSSNGESNEECDGDNSEENKPSFLDPTNLRAKWWSDSDESESM